jgi:hypothetical protein
MYKAFYHIPFGDHILNMDEGEHAVQINSTALCAVLDPQVNYNLITCSTQACTKLNTISTPSHIEHAEGIMYSAHVLIDLGSGPLLPGMFLLTEDYIPGGYDLVLGKPWMMGVERYFANPRFNQTPEVHHTRDDNQGAETTFSPDNPVDAPYITTLTTMQDEEQWITDTSDNPEETTWTATWLQKRGFTECTSFVESAKRIKAGTNQVAERSVPSCKQSTSSGLGGLFAKTLWLATCGERDWSADEAAEVIEALFNRSTPALRIANEVFTHINIFDGHLIANIISEICKTVSGSEKTAVTRGEEDLLGQALAQLITGYAKEKPILSGFGAKYKPVDKKKNPVPISVPIMKREPYKPIPVPTLPEFPLHPPSLKEFCYTDRLTQEHLEVILNNIPHDFLSKDELALPTSQTTSWKPYHTNHGDSHQFVLQTQSRMKSSRCYEIKWIMGT